MKRCSKPLVIRELQIKTTMGYFQIPNRITKIENLENIENTKCSQEW